MFHRLAGRDFMNINDLLFRSQIQTGRQKCFIVLGTDIFINSTCLINKGCVGEANGSFNWGEKGCNFSGVEETS